MKSTKLMKSMACAAVLACASLSAFAAPVFEFSITNAVGNVAGTVKGKIFGLSHNGSGSATRVTIETFPAGLNSIFGAGPIDATAWNQQYENSFTVANDVITAASFWSQASVNGFGSAAQLYINGAGGPYNFVNIDGTDTHYVWGQNGMSGVTFSLVGDSANVPEPGSLALLGLGIAGVATMRRRKAA
jgi:hypothetical protein